MFRLIYLAVLLYLLYLLIKGLLKQGKAYKDETEENVIDEMVQDPVCKTYVPRREAVKRTFGGNEILFCSKECADKFELRKNNN